MKLAYIAGKYTGHTREEVQANIDAAEAVGKEMLLRGMVPIIPHRITGHWERDQRFDHMDHGDWMKACIAMLSKCDVIVMCPGWIESKGALEEHSYASITNKQIIYFEQTV